MLREKKVYCNGIQIDHFVLKGVIEYEVKHVRCSSCTSHHVTKNVYLDGTTYLGSDPIADYVKDYVYHHGSLDREITNIRWVGTPALTRNRFMEEVEEEPPCKCAGCKVTVKTEAGKTEIEIEGVPV